MSTRTSCPSAGALCSGASAIEGANPGAYRWRQIGTRSLNGVVGDASVATVGKGERLLAAVARAVADALIEPRFWTAPI